MKNFHVSIGYYSDSIGERDGYMLTVIHNGNVIREEYDGGEPEDQTFVRDWSWVQEAIEQAYNLGLEDGKKE